LPQNLPSLLNGSRRKIRRDNLWEKCRDLSSRSFAN
jgi:hypothetical protein